MAKTNYSHAFLVGVFNKVPSKSNLKKNGWIHSPLSVKDYYRDCSTYYKSHIDAMVELNPVDSSEQKRPDFLQSIKHYYHEISEEKRQIQLSGTKFNPKTGETEVVCLDSYNLNICGLHVYLFPLEIAFFVIEIDDSSSELNDLTQGHYWLMTLSPFLLNHSKEQINNVLKPLMAIVKVKNYSDLLQRGNKMKLFQIVQAESSQIDEQEKQNLLYEISTSTAIGSVSANNHMSPALDYVNTILKENTVSAFKEWKALSLMDSFTVLSFESRFDPWACLNQYFPYIYLRCIYEKAFCFSRNDMFRIDKKGKNLNKEMMIMEKYYFYDDISYNFLPNMIYKSMAKGLGLKEEKNYLFKQIKEKADNNKSIWLSSLSALAVFSVCNTLSINIENLVNLIWDVNDYDIIINVVLFGIALVVSALTFCYLYSNRKI